MLPTVIWYKKLFEWWITSKSNHGIAYYTPGLCQHSSCHCLILLIILSNNNNFNNINLPFCNKAGCFSLTTRYFIHARTDYRYWYVFLLTSLFFLFLDDEEISALLASLDSSDIELSEPDDDDEWNTTNVPVSSGSAIQCESSESSDDDSDQVSWSHFTKYNYFIK